MHKFLVLLFFMFTLSSCSSIIKGTSQVITITSSPSGASVSVDGSPMGRTPLSLSLKKNTYSSITISKEGFSTQIRQMQKSYDAITLLNIFWDLSTTDMITGAAYEYQPNTFHFELEKSNN